MPKRRTRRESPRSRDPLRRLPAAALLCAALALLPGCVGPLAVLRPAPGDAQAGPPTDGPPELDFLVGREAELDGRFDEALAAYGRALSKDPDDVYLLKQLAELSARQNRLTDALVYAERAFELSPEEEGVRLFLGTLHRLRKDVENARRVLTDPDGGPFSADAALLLYGVLSDAKRYDEALGLADWMIAEDPDTLRGWFARADAYEKLGDPQAAEAALRRGLEHHPDELALYGALARGRRDRGDRVGEIAIYREVLEKHPDHHGTLLALGEAQLALRHTDEALETLRRVEELHPDDLRTGLRIGFIAFEREDFETARERFAEALAAHPEQHEIAYFLGVTLLRLEREQEAVDVFARIPEDHERFAEARTQIAAVLERHGDYDRAIAEIERAREMAAGRPLDLYLASLHAKAGRVDEALVFLESLLEESPDDAELLYNIGVIHGEARNVDEAIRYMKLVLGQNPDHAGALNYVGYTWAERGTNLDEAERLISRALELRPDDGYITDSLGWVYYMRARPLLERGEVEEAHALLGRAVDQLERAHDLTGGDPVISEHLGDAYLLLGERERALRMYEEALRLEPRFDEQPELLEKLERLRKELGRR